MDNLDEKAETGCCPRFDPEPWEEKEISWNDKLFVKDRVRSFLHIPLNFGGVVRRNTEKIKAADALPPEALMLSDESSPWRSDVYIAVAKEVPEAQTVKISGTFLSRVFEGPYKDAGKWHREMSAWVEAKGRTVKKMYSFYTTCPRCAQVYGKNYTVVLAQV